MLVAFDAPTGLAVGQRLLSSIDLCSPDRLLLLGRVVRVERCSDFRSYVAIAFEEGQPDLVEWWGSLRSDPEQVDRPALTKRTKRAKAV